jgi:uncharacterized protein YodC (DUF2158 family)
MIDPAPISGALPLEPGDVVRMKSGGPGMTVVAVKDDGVHCIWYADMTDEVRTAVIPAICLELTDIDDLDDDDDDDDDIS